MTDSQDGLCECGCGSPTPLAPRNRKSAGWVKGQPIRFIHGHARRSKRPAYTVDDRTGCWVWGRVRDTDGYGVDNGRRAHRVVYEKSRRPIPAGMLLHHTCHNPPCVNPDHLEVISHRDHQRIRRDMKLSAEDARAIRASRETGRALANRYGVSTAMISLIRSGKRWA